MLEGYEPRGKLLRLMHLANTVPESRARALSLAHDILKSGVNTRLYRVVCEQGGELLGPERVFDAGWVMATDASALERQKVLERDLTLANSGQSKLLMHRANTELGKFHVERGDPMQAVSSFNRAIDFADAREKLHDLLAVAQCSMELGQWPNVDTLVFKLRSYPCDDPILGSKIACVEGLSCLHKSDIAGAARAFVDVSAELGDHFAELLTLEDVALYGGLCALASFARPEMKSKVLENKVFLAILELCPRVRDGIKALFSSKYAEGLATLSPLRVELAQDMFIGKCLETVFRSIRHQALEQYFRPYSSVDLVRMAAAFNAPVEAIISDLSDLIMAGKIQGRIDCRKKALVGVDVNQRAAAFQKALAAGQAFASEAKLLVLRSSLDQYDVSVKLPRPSGMGREGKEGPREGKEGRGDDDGFDPLQAALALSASEMADD